MAIEIWQRDIFRAGGTQVAPFATVEIRLPDTLTKADLFEDEAGLVPKDNPFNADANGYAFAYLEGGSYDVLISVGNQQKLYPDTAVGGGGGSGFVVQGNWDMSEQFTPAVNDPALDTGGMTSVVVSPTNSTATLGAGGILLVGSPYYSHVALQNGAVTKSGVRQGRLQFPVLDGGDNVAFGGFLVQQVGDTFQQTFEKLSGIGITPGDGSYAMYMQFTAAGTYNVIACIDGALVNPVGQGSANPGDQMYMRVDFENGIVSAHDAAGTQVSTIDAGAGAFDNESAGLRVGVAYATTAQTGILANGGSFDLSSTDNGQLAFGVAVPAELPADVADGLFYKVTGAGSYNGTSAVVDDIVGFYNSTASIFVIRQGSFLTQAALTAALADYATTATTDAIDTRVTDNETDILALQNAFGSSVLEGLVSATRQVVGWSTGASVSTAYSYIVAPSPTGVFGAFIPGNIATYNSGVGEWQQYAPRDGDKVRFYEPSGYGSDGVMLRRMSKHEWEGLVADDIANRLTLPNEYTFSSINQNSTVQSYLYANVYDMLRTQWWFADHTMLANTGLKHSRTITGATVDVTFSPSIPFHELTVGTTTSTIQMDFRWNRQTGAEKYYNNQNPQRTRGHVVINVPAGNSNDVLVDLSFLGTPSLQDGTGWGARDFYIPKSAGNPARAVAIEFWVDDNNTVRWKRQPGLGGVYDRHHTVIDGTNPNIREYPFAIVAANPAAAINLPAYITVGSLDKYTEKDVLTIYFAVPVGSLTWGGATVNGTLPASASAGDIVRIHYADWYGGPTIQRTVL